MRKLHKHKSFLGDPTSSLTIISLISNWWNQHRFCSWKSQAHTHLPHMDKLLTTLLLKRDHYLSEWNNTHICQFTVFNIQKVNPIQVHHRSSPQVSSLHSASTSLRRLMSELCIDPAGAQWWAHHSPEHNTTKLMGPPFHKHTSTPCLVYYCTKTSTPHPNSPRKWHTRHHPYPPQSTNFELPTFA